MLDIFFVIVRDPHLSGRCSLESGAGNGYRSEGLDEGIKIPPVRVPQLQQQQVHDERLFINSMCRTDASFSCTWSLWRVTWSCTCCCCLRLCCCHTSDPTFFEWTSSSDRFCCSGFWMSNLGWWLSPTFGRGIRSHNGTSRWRRWQWDVGVACSMMRGNKPCVWWRKN